MCVTVSTRFTYLLLTGLHGGPASSAATRAARSGQGAGGTHAAWSAGARGGGGAAARTAAAGRVLLALHGDGGLHGR